MEIIVEKTNGNNKVKNFNLKYAVRNKYKYYEILDTVEADQWDHFGPYHT